MVSCLLARACRSGPGSASCRFAAAAAMASGYPAACVLLGAVLFSTAALQIDTDKAFNLPGSTLNVSALQIHGNNDFSASYVASIQTANGNEAVISVRTVVTL
jgi:hypothetical protein